MTSFSEFMEEIEKCDGLKDPSACNQILFDFLKGYEDAELMLKIEGLWAGMTPEVKRNISYAASTDVFPLGFWLKLFDMSEDTGTRHIILAGIVSGGRCAKIEEIARQEILNRFEIIGKYDCLVKQGVLDRFKTRAIQYLEDI